jgi:hypothetical protein
MAEGNPIFRGGLKVSIIQTPNADARPEFSILGSE